MNTQKIFTYTALVLGVVGLILQAIILSQGDDVIKLNALSGDYGVVSTMVTLALLVLAITVVLTLVFSFGNLASDGKKLKKALISIGAFAAVVLVAFLFSTGTETPLKDGDILSAAGSRWIETGLRTFYFLVFIAVGAMLYTGIARLKK
jgi:NADH:ubiquinone oxidoreductase subunit 6 (subunit J)